MHKAIPTLLLLLAVSLPTLPSELTTRTGSGSGFIITPDGYILTNYHVVEGATDVEVWLQNGIQLKATVVDYSPTWEDGGHDIALLKVAAGTLSALSLGDSGTIGLFQSIVAIGYPLGFQLGTALTATGGHVSTFRRATEQTNVYQIDAAINPGNSGGPLVDDRGLVVGIVTAGITKLEGVDVVQGVNFAVPVDYAHQLVARNKITLPPPVPAPVGTSIQEVVRAAAASVVYIESTSEAPLASLLPAQLAGYGQLSSPDVWPPPPPPPPDPARLDALVALLQRVLLDLLKPDSPGEDLLLEAPRWLPSGESELKVAAMCASDLLELMTPEELCARLEPSSIPQLAADCPSSIAELAAAGVAIRTTNLLALERWALPRFDLTEFPFLDSPNGESLDVPLDRLGTAPLKYVHSAASGTYSVDFLIASFESPVVAAEEATGLPNGDLAGMTIVEKGELAAGPVSGYYAIGYDTAYNHWQTHSGLDSSMVRYASYQPQYYANASAHVCVRASVAFSIQEVLFAISFSWEDVRTDRVSLGFSPLAYPVTAIISVGQYGFSDGCIWHTATAKSPSQVLLCTETVLDQLKDLVDAQIEALKAALGE